MDKRIGFIGCGNMAQSMIGGILNSKIVTRDNVIASNTSDSKLIKISELHGIDITNDNKRVARNSDVIILAVKPNKYEEVIEEIKDDISTDSIVVSIAAGISLSYIERKFNRKVKLIRAMPNISSAINEGMTAISKNKEMTIQDTNYIIEIFNSIGEVELIEEELMDKVPAISSSSPAYTFMFIDALAKGGVVSGIPEEKAYKLAAQAVLGAAKMILKDSKNINNLKDMVCSPGGCTIDALNELENNNFNEAIALAMTSCTNKVLKLAKDRA